MKRDFLPLSAALLAVFLLLGACQDRLRDDALRQEASADYSRNAVELPEREGIYPDRIYIKFRASASQQLQHTASGTIALSSVPTATQHAIEQLSTGRLQPCIELDPRYEERQRAWGLDRWYVLYLDNKRHDPLLSTARLQKLEDIEIAEPAYKPVVPEGHFTAVRSLENKHADPALPFDDPGLIEQWHYNNTGKLVRSKPGADIRLYDAWKIETGKPSVVVAVIDEGVDYDHEDLKESMWVNEKELNGQLGVDDDGNGYVDDIHGYSFIDFKHTPPAPGTTPKGPHGTHVAGTIAARNGNHVGVCGIAGGNGDPASGVRIMTCPIFRKDDEPSNSPSAFVYAADNGAIIAQNSWGYRYPGIARMPAFLKSCIDYFIRYAGCDKKGNQKPDSPMKGGVVIFAAGNDHMDFVAYPGAYEEVVAVSAMGADFVKSVYTNRGDWVDVMAPGGDKQRFGESGGVLSTLTGREGLYGFYEGTSMACPHVSGIAALVVSKYGGPGFSNEELKQRISSSVLPVNIDEHNKGFEGRLGIGYISAAAALQAKGANVKPEPTASATAEPDYYSIDLSWKVAKDENDGLPLRYLLYISEKPMSAANYSSAVLLGRNISVAGKALGEQINYKVAGLRDHTTYYFAIVAEDRWAERSIPYIFSAKTLQNFAPEPALFSSITPGFTSAKIAWRVPADKNDEKPSHFLLYYSEKELTAQNYETGTQLTMGSDEAILTDGKKVGEELSVELKGLKLHSRYYLALVAVDRWGKRSEVSLNQFETKENNPPEIKELPAMPLLLSSIGEKKLLIPVHEPDGQDWSVSLSGETSGVSAEKTAEGLLLKLLPVLAAGDYEFSVQLVDELGAEASYPFRFTIFEYHRPKYLGGLEPLLIGLNSGELQIKLSELFEHSKYYPLQLQAKSYDSSIAAVELSKDNVLSIFPKKKGQTSVRISSTDGVKKGDDASFEIRVVEDANAAVHLVYPIPVRRDLHILANASMSSFVAVVSTLSGEEVLRETLHPDAYHTAVLPLKQLPPASYVLQVKGSAGTYKRVFLKR